MVSKKSLRLCEQAFELIQRFEAFCVLLKKSGLKDTPNRTYFCFGHAHLVFTVCVKCELNVAWSSPLCLSPQKLFMMDDREVVSVKMEDPRNSVEFRNATLAWEKARPSAARPNPPPKKRRGIMRVLRKEKLSLYISTEDSKDNKEVPNTQSLLTNMEQESPQSTISSSQSIRPPLHKTLHRIDLHIKRVTTHTRTD